jgi:hypothetical protein
LSCSDSSYAAACRRLLAGRGGIRRDDAWVRESDHGAFHHPSTLGARTPTEAHPIPELQLHRARLFSETCSLSTDKPSPPFCSLRHLSIRSPIQSHCIAACTHFTSLHFTALYCTARKQISSPAQAALVTLSHRLFLQSKPPTQVTPGACTSRRRAEHVSASFPTLDHCSALIREAIHSCRGVSG